MPSDIEISEADDLKLLTLARGARARVGAVSGAAVRDDTGRTYSSASVALPSLSLTALEACIAQAVASGARGLEAAVVVGGTVGEVDLRLVREAGGRTCPVWECALDGSVMRCHESQ